MILKEFRKSQKNFFSGIFCESEMEEIMETPPNSIGIGGVMFNGA